MDEESEIIDLEPDDWFLERCGKFSSEMKILKMNLKLVTIGRADSMTYCFTYNKNHFMSRHHATFTFEKGSWFLQDKKSLNGIYVNEGKISSDVKIQLYENDIIGFGVPTTKMDDSRGFIYCLHRNKNLSIVHSFNTKNVTSVKNQLICDTKVSEDGIHRPVFQLEIEKKNEASDDCLVVEEIFVTKQENLGTSIKQEMIESEKNLLRTSDTLMDKEIRICENQKKSVLLNDKTCVKTSVSDELLNVKQEKLDDNILNIEMNKRLIVRLDKCDLCDISHHTNSDCWNQGPESVINNNEININKLVISSDSESEFLDNIKMVAKKCQKTKNNILDSSDESDCELSETKMFPGRPIEPETVTDVVTKCLSSKERNVQNNTECSLAQCKNMPDSSDCNLKKNSQNIPTLSDQCHERIKLLKNDSKLKTNTCGSSVNASNYLNKCTKKLNDKNINGNQPLQRNLNIRNISENVHDLTETVIVAPKGKLKNEDSNTILESAGEIELAHSGYTQEDEIIIISDDDEQYFSLSQKDTKCHLNIKTEHNDWIADGVEEFFLLESRFELSKETNLISDVIKEEDMLNEFEDECAVTSNKINGNLNMNSQTSIEDGKLEKSDKDKSASSSNGPISTKDDDNLFFPELSQSFYSDSEDNLVVDNVEKKTKSTANERCSTKFYGTKYNPALPLLKKRRSNIPIPKNSKQLKINENPILHKKNKKKETGNLREKIIKGLGYRIPIPGGGSDVCLGKKDLLNLKTCAAKDSFTKALNQSNVSKAPSSSKEKSLTNSASKTNSRKNSKSVDRFRNRSTFLTEMSNNLICAPHTKTCPKITEKVHSNSSYKCEKQETVTTANIDWSTSTSEVKEIAANISVMSSASKPQAQTLRNITNKETSLLHMEMPVQSTAVSSASENKRKQEEVLSLAKRVRFSEQNETFEVESTLRKKKSSNAKKSCSENQISDVCAPGLKLKNDVQLDDILKIIISWNPVWLSQQVTNSVPPPVVKSNSIWPTLLAYKSFDDYFRVFQPLLLLETWAQITQDWESQHGIFLTSAFVVQTASCLNEKEMPNQIMEFSCLTLYSEEEFRLQKFVQEGHLIIMDVPLIHNDAEKHSESSKQVLKVFGYVAAFNRMARHNANTLKHCPVLANHSLGNNFKAVLTKIIIRSKFRQVPVDFQKLMRVQVVSYLKPCLRKFKALIHLPNNILARDILSPRLHVFQLHPNIQTAFKATGRYNAHQKDVILSISDACSLGGCPKISLVLGPPGTGKTHTIVGIIEQLLQANDMKQKSGIKPKILLTAPSNAAVDEIVIRINKVKQENDNKYRIRLVRIGQSHQIHPQVRDYTLDALVENNLKRRIQEKSSMESVEMELNTLEAKLNGLNTKLDSLHVRNKTEGLNTVEAQKIDIEKKILRLRKQKELCQPTNLDCYREKQKLVCELLTKADVIATTLGSCRQSHMEIVFANKLAFSACIIDEASQCIEQDALAPLMFNISKLILIGDPMQLPPTVLSQRALEMGLNQSLFERFHQYFKSSKSNPIWLLNIQYRMHPAICKFPAKYFYEDELQSDSLLECKYRSCPLVPYLVFDVQHARETRYKSDIYNECEIDFIITLSRIILKLTDAQSTRKNPKFSFGIITPYQCQKQRLKDALKTKIPENCSRFEVNTIDGFQGKEKDVIILSTVRAKSSDGKIGFLNQEKRLNVALTRARQSFFVCGHFDTLKVNSYWRALFHNAQDRGLVMAVNSMTKSEYLEQCIMNYPSA